MARQADTRAAPAAAEVRAALERVLGSRTFEHAGRSSDFLRFAVAETLAGRAKLLKGYTIAVNVFGRPPDFDAQSDPLVRVEALRLRQRLLEYYAGDGRDDPVRLELPRGGYAVESTYAPAPPTEQPTGQELPPISGRGRGRRLVPWLVAGAIVIGGFTLLRPAPSADAPELAIPPEQAHKTRIVVVPLESLSADTRFNRLAAGLTEEILLRLGDLDLFVIATQAQWYDSKSPLEGVFGSEHSYLLTGSVREHAGGARIGVRIIEGETGTQLWSAAYDEPASIGEQPAMQVKVARAVAAAAGPFGPVFAAELALARREAHTLELPDCQTRYRAFRRSTDPTLFPEAAACFQSLVERQPHLADAWAGLAMVAIDEHLFYSGSGDAASPLARGFAAARKALKLDGSNAIASMAFARAQYYHGDADFIVTAERALTLDPTNIDVLTVIGLLLTTYGDDTHGLELVARAQALSPRPRLSFHLAHAFARLRNGESCQALESAHAMDAPNWFLASTIATAAGALCGDATATAAARRRLLALAPNFEAEAVTLIGYWRFDSALRDTLLDGLRKAGLELYERH